MRSQRGPLALALLSVVASSLAPLGIAIGNGAASPFLFSAAIKFGTFLAHGTVLAVYFRHVLADRQAMERVIGRVLTWSMAFMVVQQFDWTLFILASRFVDIAIVVVVFGTTTTIYVFLLSRLFPHYQRIGTNAALLLTGLLGLWFAASSDTGRLLGFGGFLSPGTPVGVLLAFLAAGTAAMTVVGLRWGIRLFRVLPADKGAALSDRVVEVCCIAMGQSIANLIGGALQVSIGFAIGESITPGSLGIAVATGAVVVAGRTPRRAANLATTNLGINAVLYATPVVTLVWLLLFGQTEILRLDYLVIGAVAIVITSLLINFKAEIRSGFKALMLALWACGTIVYLRDDLLLLERFPIADLEWDGGTYLGALTLSATVFTLLLSFRTNRLAARTQDEDDRVFALFVTVDRLARCEVIGGDVRRHLLDVDDAHDPEELQSAYRRVQACFTEATKAGDLSPENEKLLAEAETQLNIVVHSRRHGVELGELFALMIFGGITVLLAMGARPESVGWNGFLAEVFGALFSAVIVFFMIHVWDMHGDRTTHVLEKLPDSDRYGVAFRDIKSRRSEQAVSIVVGFGIILAYLGLFWSKWLGVGGAM